MSSDHFFSIGFVQRLMQEHNLQKQIVVKKIQPFEVDNSASILAVLTSGRTSREIGHFGIKVTYEEDGVQQVRKMVMKIKPHGTEIVEMLNSLAQGCGGRLAEVYDKFKTRTGFQQTHVREQEIYKKLSPAIAPEIFGLYTDNREEVYIILMEFLQDVELLNLVMQTNLWTDEHIKETLKEMAWWHTSMLEVTSPLDMKLWDDAPSLSYMLELKPLWQALLDNASKNFPYLYTEERVQILQAGIDNIETRWSVLVNLPKTLVHNDCNPRNSCFKFVDGHKTFCLYDWELSTFHIPQYDVVEFLSFVLDEDRYDQRNNYIEFYRQELSKQTGQYTDAKVFREELKFAAYDFALHRVGMYMMAHTVSPYPFLPRVVNSLFDTFKNEPVVIG
jgi:hypothetical protein